eukprot:COSAG02_NODE_50957_length_317_cov_0.821101_1_plen_85_part_01
MSLSGVITRTHDTIPFGVCEYSNGCICMFHNYTAWYTRISRGPWRAARARRRGARRVPTARKRAPSPGGCVAAGGACVARHLLVV